MLLYVLPAITGVALLGVTFQYAATRAEVGSAPVVSRLDLVQHQQFLFAADQFMKSANAPTAPGPISWETIRQSATTPPGMRALPVPLNWKVVKTADSWVACAAMSDQAATALNQFMPSESTSSGSSTATVKPLPQRLNLAGGNADGYYVLGAADAAKAQELATVCKDAGA